MARKAVHAKIEELKTDNVVVKNLELSIGRILDETWTEPVGPTPFPSVTDLADIPITMKDGILKILEEKGWKERKIPDPTLISRLIRKRETQTSRTSVKSENSRHSKARR